ncbi:hypothetical protein AAFO92_10765 [Roseovarius sp. CAU 1744]|uniref:hypothetical protein n=1 Tax=Roseovarius sp. CAU 1744 TaxID=3140368 RepID=UPI00325ADEC5
MRLYVLLLATLTWVPLPALAETYLLMAEEQGCHWCARWNKEIAHIYPKTDEGKTAPLRRYDLHSETPEAALTRRVHYTPTFILVHDGHEVGRIEGYPGEDFFWGLLTNMFERANISLEQTG